MVQKELGDNTKKKWSKNGVFHSIKVLYQMNQPKINYGILMGNNFQKERIKYLEKQIKILNIKYSLL
jgi:hypothetical protein